MAPLQTQKQSPGLQYALAAVCMFLPTVFTALRFRVRRVQRVQFAWDDWLILFSLVFVYAHATWLMVGTVKGYQGQHMLIGDDNLPIPGDQKYRWFLICLYAGQLCAILAIGPTKISVLLFYRRIFRGTWFHRVTWTLILLCSAWTIAFLFANLFECMPISDAFKHALGTVYNGNCIDAVPMYLTQAYWDVILDVFILLIPIPMIYKLRLPLRQKIAVLGIFLLGGITVISSSAKVMVFNSIGGEIEERYDDITYYLSPVAYWPLIEASLQIIAACLPLLRPFIEDWTSIFHSRPKLHNSTEYTQSPHGPPATFDPTIFVNRHFLLELDDLPLCHTRAHSAGSTTLESCMADGAHSPVLLRAGAAGAAPRLELLKGRDA